MKSIRLFMNRTIKEKQKKTFVKISNHLSLLSYPNTGPIPTPALYVKNQRCSGDEPLSSLTSLQWRPFVKIMLQTVQPELSELEASDFVGPGMGGSCLKNDAHVMIRTNVWFIM